MIIFSERAVKSLKIWFIGTLISIAIIVQLEIISHTLLGGFFGENYFDAIGMFFSPIILGIANGIGFYVVIKRDTSMLTYLFLIFIVFGSYLYLIKGTMGDVFFYIIMLIGSIVLSWMLHFILKFIKNITK